MPALGLGGIQEQARRRLKNEEDPEKCSFLRAVCIAYEGARTLIHRYIDPLLYQWNSALLLHFHPTAVAGQEGREKGAHFLRTFLQLGGVQLQGNVVDAETLRAAQKHPEQ